MYVSPPVIQNDYYVKSRSLTSPMKKLKDQNNYKIKISDTKRKLHNLMTHLKSFEVENDFEKELVYTRKTVKEITDYFEGISKFKKDINDNISTEGKPYTIFPTKTNREQNIPIMLFPNSNIHLQCSNNTTLFKKLNTARKANLHVQWKSSVLNARSVYCTNLSGKKSENILTNIRSSLRSMMLQYIM